MRRLLFILLLIPAPCLAQFSVGIAPTSIPAWGRAEGVRMAEISYASFGLHFFLQPEEVAHAKESLVLVPSIRTEYHHNAAISYRHSFFEHFRIGLISFLYEFPEPEGSRLNLWLGVGYDIGRFRFSYNHISNAFMGKSNLGYDSLSVSFRLNRDP